MSIKTSDLHTVPLCDLHHKEWHKNAEIYPFDHEATELLFSQAMVDSLGLALQSGLNL